jgi:chitodextrinase
MPPLPPIQIMRRYGAEASLPRCAALLLACLALAVASPGRAQDAPVTFSVIGDIPYSGSEALFQSYVDEHNLMSPADFFVHVGDIMSQSGCHEPAYALASDIMSQLAVPTFVVPGDNEWNDCSDPDAAWVLWESYFSEFEQRFCGTPPVDAQPARPENFAFVDRGVLFVGLNLVGGAVHDRAEWDVRLQQDADWVEQQFAAERDRVRAAVVFAHADRDGSRDIFFDQFDLSAVAFGKPIMFIHGNGHSWSYRTSWGAPNIWRIQVEKNDPPLEFTVTMDPGDPFVFVRDPWPAGTPPYNRPPCVEVGPDQSIRLGEGVRVDGFASDDGVPTADSLSTTWSQASGPGQASFVDPGALSTDVTFSQAGVYVLRLTADDGGLATSADVAVQVASGDPDLRIRDVSVSEGHSGTLDAVFTVQLLSATGDLVTVDYTTADETATAGEDYQATSGSLAFSGATFSQTIVVPVIGDEATEARETFLVSLSNAVGAGILVGTGTGSIIDDDVPPVPVVSAFEPVLAPPGETVTVTGSFFTGVVAVEVAGAPAEFAIASESRLEVVVPAGATSGPIRVTNATGTGVSAASFDIAYTLSLELTGAGGVILDPPGGLYPPGSAVTLTPAPGPGAEFLAWGGDEGGVDVPGEIAMDRSKRVTAWFVDEGSVARVSRSVQVAGGDDDAEEDVSSGRVSLSSSDLELAETGGNAQLIGMRFAGLDVPRAATVISANVQFTADETNGDAATLQIHVQASDDAAPFDGTTGSVSGRPVAGASVRWSPPDWKTPGAAGAAQRSEDVSALVQEIVAGPGWVPGNALALVISGSGTRTAESFEGDPTAAPRLDVIYAVDLRAPEPPAALRASAVGETHVDLNWDSARDNVGVTGYRLYLPSGPVEVAATSYSVTGLASDREYGFQVSALDAAGFESPPSAVLRVRTKRPDREPPTTPPGLHSSAQTETSVDLAWEAASDDVGVVGYRLYRPSGPIDVSETSHVEAGLDPGGEYGFQVAALDASGNESQPSPVLIVRTRLPDREAPTAPQGLGSPLQTQTAIELSWEAASDDVGVTGYRIHRAGSSVDVVATSYTETGLAPDREYGFQVSALDAAGHESLPSAPLWVRTLASHVDLDAPTPPRNLRSPAQTGTSIDLVWDASTDDVGVESYRVYRPGGPVEVAETSHRETGLTPDRAYGFQVSALDAAGHESYLSPVMTVRTLPPDRGVPTTPEGLHSPVQTTSSVELAWNAASDDVGVTGYRLYRPSGAVVVIGTSYVETGLAPDSEYGFQVSALDAAGHESVPGPVLMVRTSSVDVDLDAPTQPRNLRSLAQSGTRIDLAWDAASDDVGVAGYRVYLPSGPIDVTGTTWAVTGLSEDTEYGFQVSALDTAGLESMPSPTLLVRTARPDREPPTVPQNLRSPLQTLTSIELAWDASSDDVGVADYRVYGPTGSVATPGTAFTWTDLDPDTRYEFQVSALDAAGNESALTAVLEVWTGAPDPVVQSVGVASGDDDAEEDLSSGGVNLTSRDLELAVTGGGAVQAVGIRFTGIGIPRGAMVLSASVQFTVDESTAGAASLTLRGEASDDAAPFAGTTGEVSGRPVTSASVAWIPPDWATVGAAGPDQRTADLSAVVQEIVDRAGWAPGNALVLIVTGTGTRTAESYDGAVGAAPRLEVTYLPAPDLVPPSAPSNLRSPVQTESSIDLAWDASSDDVGVVGYRVYGPHGAVDVPGTSHTETGLGADAEYAFEVTALDAAGRESPRSPLLLARTRPPDLEPPTTPQNLRSPLQTGSTIEIAWDASTDDVGVEGYRVYGPGGAVDVVGTGYVQTGLVPNSAYDFQVSALDAAGNESVLSVVLSASTGAPDPVALSIPVASGADDAEEDVATGAVRLTSSDLELVTDRAAVQRVGVRFTAVSVPPGARITRAWVQFSVDEVGSDPASLELRMEAADHAAPFTTTAADLSARTTTSASVPWTPGPWSAVGDAGPDQRTPDLAALVQEVVDRPGWNAGNSLVLLVSGSGARVADSYDGGAAGAAVLVVEYLE